MIALTICQPWASAIAIGPKRWENRPWQTSYLGPILIHAGKSDKYFGTCSQRLWPRSVPDEDLPRGAIVAIADLAGCQRIEDVRGEPFAEGPWCLRIANVRPIEPIPWKGAQRFFYVPDSILDEFVYLGVQR